ncbi:MAG: NAD(P)/FAD-dependent oxidoreductase [Vicingus serpentipes]|nr:NAD(P)/FAD-dependent oxidoreductase [Vicingus serpentipes]
MNVKTDVLIVGAGASGVFAAINVANQHPHLNILIIEKTSKPLSKVKVSGGGRCNVTHACFDPKELIKYYPRGNKELLSAFYQFQPGDIIEWFEQRGVTLKIEEDGRMFPITDNSQTIIDCFLKEIQSHNIQIHYQTSLQKIETKKDGFIVRTNVNEYECKQLLIASGGISKLEQGKVLSDLGHQIITPAPSLFTFNLPNNAITQLQGVVCEAEVQIMDTKFIEQGPLLITHWGMSGPAILKLSSWGARYLQEKNYQFRFQVNWLPNHSLDSVVQHLEKIKTTNGSKKVINQLDVDVPKKLKFYLLEKAGFNNELRWAEINKNQLQQLATILTSDIYEANGKTTFKQEFVSCGGVKLNEVNFKTMESKIVPNLYFSGEILDIDALTGGFNFQAAWTTAWIVAKNMG